MYIYGDNYDNSFVPDDLVCLLPGGELFCAGNWLLNQKIEYSIDNLENHQMERLQQLVDKQFLNWEIKESEEEWHDMFLQVECYFEEKIINEIVPFNFNIFY